MSIMDSYPHRHLDHEIAEVLLDVSKESFTQDTPVVEEFKYSHRYSRSAYSRREDARSMLERGYTPWLGNGWSFVIDRRPDGHEEDHISAQEYTGYFSNRQIPLADADHRLRDHDIGHVPSYQTLFSNPLFAEVVQNAATNALADPEMCEKFTNAMDGIGDSARNIEEGSTFIGDKNAARLNLDRLIALLPEGYDDVGPNTPNGTLFNRLWESMPFAHVVTNTSSDYALGGYGMVGYTKQYKYEYEEMPRIEEYMPPSDIYTFRQVGISEQKPE